MFDRLPLGRLLAAAALLVVPLWIAGAGADRFAGTWSLDLAGHLWTAWNGAQGDPTRSELVAWPHGVDLMPILGGWLDVLTVSALVRLGLPLLLAWNIVLGVILALAGFGGAALARALGAGTLGALLAGLLLQLDGWTLFHLLGGRTEQAALGPVAFAVAGAIRCWREPGWRGAVTTGLWGAVVVWFSWEHGVWLAVGMAVMLPFFLWEGVGPGAVRRWAAAAGVTALLAGPWALLFLVRALGTRSATEGLDTLQMARENAAPVLWWLVHGTEGTARPLLWTLVGLPWLVRARDRRLWAGAALLLGLALVLGMGPSPGLWSAGDLMEEGGPYVVLQSLPVLGWFHTPQRLLVVWTLLVPVVGGLLVSRLRQRAGRGVAVAVGLVLLAAAGDQALRLRLLPPQVRTLGPDAVTHALADVEGPGAVLDLPVVEPGEASVAYQTAQIHHGRPIPYQATLPMLTPARAAEVMAWTQLSALASGTGVVPDEALLQRDLAGLRARGVRFVVVHQRVASPRAASALQQALGPPAFSAPGKLAWDLGPLPEE